MAKLNLKQLKLCFSTQYKNKIISHVAKVILINNLYYLRAKKISFLIFFFFFCLSNLSVY